VPQVVVLSRSRVVAESVGQALRGMQTEPLCFAAADDLSRLLARSDLTPDVAVIVESESPVLGSVAPAVRERWPAARLISSGLALPTDVTPALIVSGIVGVVLAPEPLGALRIAIRRVLRGELSASPSVHRVLLASTAMDPSDGQHEPLTASLSLLSSREEQVFRLLSSEPAHANKDIARELGLEVQTVKNHVRSIYRKLGITRRRDVASPQTMERRRRAEAPAVDWCLLVLCAVLPWYLGTGTVRVLSGTSVLVLFWYFTGTPVLVLLWYFTGTFFSSASLPRRARRLREAQGTTRCERVSRAM
jgi:two-component system nitrate/nitrite response regulator NarL